MTAALHPCGVCGVPIDGCGYRCRDCLLSALSALPEPPYFLPDSAVARSLGPLAGGTAPLQAIEESAGYQHPAAGGFLMPCARRSFFWHPRKERHRNMTLSETIRDADDKLDAATVELEAAHQAVLDAERRRSEAHKAWQDAPKPDASVNRAARALT